VENWKTGGSSLITSNLEISDASQAKTETGKLNLTPIAIPAILLVFLEATEHIGLD
jgi:hypothetical protein